jgi:hypothetical protein
MIRVEAVPVMRSQWWHPCDSTRKAGDKSSSKEAIKVPFFHTLYGFPALLNSYEFVGNKLGVVVR